MSTDEATELSTWRPEYEFGIPALDSQHKILLAFAHELNQAILSADPVRINSAADALASYTRRHFQFESALMHARLYSGAARHEAAHKALLEQIESMCGALRAGQIEPSHVMELFVHVWVDQHMSGEDRELADFLHSQEAHEGKAVQGRSGESPRRDDST